jgi:hypothetical protein
MAIKRKPMAEQTSATAGIDGTAFEAYLNKGSSVAEATTSEPKKDVKFTLTIPADLCEQLDAVRSRLPIKTARPKWVLEAILEKVQRESVSSL